MQAVFNVMQNRANINFGGFGSDILSQALAPNQFQGQITNFSPDALNIANQGLSGNLADITGGATSYAVPSASTAAWATNLNNSNSLQIGSQYFTDNQNGVPFSGAGVVINSQSPLTYTGGNIGDYSNPYYPASWSSDPTQSLGYDPSLNSDPFSAASNPISPNYGDLSGSVGSWSDQTYGSLDTSSSPFGLSGWQDPSGSQTSAEGFTLGGYSQPYGGLDATAGSDTYWTQSPFSGDAADPYGGLDQSNTPSYAQINPFDTSSGVNDVMPSAGLSGGDQTGVGAMINPVQPYNSSTVQSGTTGAVAGNWEATGAKAVSQAGAAVSSAETTSTNKIVSAGTSWLSEIFSNAAQYFVRFGVLILGLIFLAGGVAWFSRQEA